MRDIVNNGKWDDPAVATFAKDYADLAAKGFFSPNITGNVFPAGQNSELATGQGLKDAPVKVYSTYYTTRKDNVWAKANPDEVQQCYLMTAFHTAG